MTNTQKPLVISLFDYTGKMVQPWVDAGYEAIIVDIQHPAGWTQDGPLSKLGFDLSRSYESLWLHIYEEIGDREVKMVFSFTPCTDMAVSGARWFKSKLAANPRLWDEALHFAKAGPYLAERLVCDYVVENPVSKLSSLWRKPNHYFQPYQFTALCPDDNYTKKTCLWTSEGVAMPEPARDENLGEPDDRIHKCGPSPERMNFRSATPMGFALAFCAANSGVALHHQFNLFGATS